MINKKYILSVCLFCTMLALAGCTKSRELTEEQQDVIAEYAAGVVLQHDEGYSRRLVEQEMVLEQTPLPTANPQVTAVPVSEEATAESTDVENTAEEVALNDLYHVAGMEAVYKSYSVCREYTKEIRASKDECMYVVSFQVKNTTDKALKVDLSKRGIRYVLDVDGGEYTAHMSFLENGGMDFLKTKLKAHSSEKAVVIFRLPEKAKKAKNVTLTITDKDRVTTIPLKQE